MLKSKENQKVPNASFKIIKDGNWETVTTEELFTNKKVIVFSLPGAFTPTCSSSHLPRYDELAESFKEEGIDEIIVMSVNDTFVMSAWEKDQGTKNITFIPDGNGDFTEQMDMLVDKEDLGFGKRSWRYSMLVVDGVIEKQFIEPDVAGDPFTVSDADTMLAYINPEKVSKSKVVILSKAGCPFCIKTKELLTENGFIYEDVTVGVDVKSSVLIGITGKEIVPQVFIDGLYIGGSEEVAKYLLNQKS